MRSGKPVLLVEDGQIDAMLFKRAFKDNHIKNPLIVVENGLEALERLRDPKKENPCLILLDLNMPKMNGIEFLKIAKQDDMIRRVPIVIFSTSVEVKDKDKCYSLGAASYIVKPIDYQKFVAMVNILYRHWSLCEMP